MLGCLSTIASSRPDIAVYRGEGAGWRSVHSTVRSLQQLLPPTFKVGTMDAQELLEGTWQGSTALLVMPGGADLPYCRRLNGHGNQLISEFVAAGGAYLGLCAGAYYACSRVEFEPGGDLEVVGDRELGFFPGVAAGAAYAGFDYMTEAGAVAAPVIFHATLPSGMAAKGEHQAQPDPAGMPVGEEGRSSRGGAVSPAASPAASCPGMTHERGSWVACWDYCNGGPVFRPHGSGLADTGSAGGPDSSNSGRSRQDSPDLPQGVMPLAYYAALPHRPHLTTSGRAVDVPAEAASVATSAAKPTQDLSAHADVAGQQPSVAALAAVRCEVGAGAAVLCSTHPELHPEWLDPAGSRHDAWQQQAQQQQQQQPQRQQPQRHIVDENVDGAAEGAAVQPEGQLHAGGVDTDEGLVWHTAALHQRLQACQASRELLLATLVWEALRHRLDKQ